MLVNDSNNFLFISNGTLQTFDVWNRIPLLTSNGNKLPQYMPIPTDISSYLSSTGRIHHHICSFNVAKQACSSDLVISFAVGSSGLLLKTALFVLSSPHRFEGDQGDSSESLPFRFDRVVIFKIFI